jgi:hypothetical protein
MYETFLSIKSNIFIKFRRFQIRHVQPVPPRGVLDVRQQVEVLRRRLVQQLLRPGQLKKCTHPVIVCFKENCLPFSPLSCVVSRQFWRFHPTLKRN